jgi:hypothetical protein
MPSWDCSIWFDAFIAMSRIASRLDFNALSVVSINSVPSADVSHSVCALHMLKRGVAVMKKDVTSVWHCCQDETRRGVNSGGYRCMVQLILSNCYLGRTSLPPSCKKRLGATVRRFHISIKYPQKGKVLPITLLEIPSRLPNGGASTSLWAPSNGAEVLLVIRLGNARTSRLTQRCLE